MEDFKKILNSGKLYRVMNPERDNPDYNSYLELMHKFNSLGYTVEAEEQKKQIAKKFLLKLDKVRQSKLPIMVCGVVIMYT